MTSRRARLGLLAALVLVALTAAACASDPHTSSKPSTRTLSGSDQSLPFTGPTGSTGNTGKPGHTAPGTEEQDPCSQAKRQAQRQLAFPPKDKMTVGQTTTVTIQLAASGHQLQQSVGATTTVIAVSTTCEVEATLVAGPQLSIEAQDPATQDFDLGPVLAWSWLVTPNASGSYQLRLDVESSQPNGIPVTLDKKDVAIDAVVAPEPASTHVGHAVTSPLGLTVLGTVLAFVLGLVLTLVSTRRKARNRA
jgi:hypothetical protein